MKLVGKSDLTADLENVRRFPPKGHNPLKTLDVPEVAYDGENIYVIGKIQNEHGRSFPLDSPGPIILGCWDINGNLQWKSRLTEEGYRAKFFERKVNEIIVWSTGGVEKLKF